MAIILSSVSDHDLGWVLIGHHDGWLRKSWSESIRVIRLKRFLHHACMVLSTIFVCWTCPWLFLRWELLVLIGVRMLPPCFIERECHCYCFSLLHNDVRTCLNSGIKEERCRFLQFFLKESLQVMQLSIVAVSRWLRSIKNSGRLRSWASLKSRVRSFNI